MTRRTRLTNSEIRMIKAERRAGASTEELAAKFNCSKSTIWNHAPLRSKQHPERTVRPTQTARFSLLLSAAPSAVAQILSIHDVKLLDMTAE